MTTWITTRFILIKIWRMILRRGLMGDSMEPTYHNGSVALIRETGFDYDGAAYAVVWNSQTYIKKVYREENGCA